MKYWDKSWSLVEQCTPVSLACQNCWLQAIDKRFGKIWNGEVKTRKDRLDIPLKTKKPTVFAVWSDLFHEKVSDEFIDKTMRVIALTEQHTFLILTKRPERMKEFFEKSNWDGGGFPYVWLGTTVENQAMADKRIPELLKCEPFKLFLSVEPMLSEIIIPVELLKKISYIICGCESGHHARETKEEWIGGLREQCLAVDLPLWVKQLRVGGKMIYNHSLSTVQREGLWTKKRK